MRFSSFRFSREWYTCHLLEFEFVRATFEQQIGNSDSDSKKKRSVRVSHLIVPIMQLRPRHGLVNHTSGPDLVWGLAVRGMTIAPLGFINLEAESERPRKPFEAVEKSFWYVDTYVFRPIFFLRNKSSIKAICVTSLNSLANREKGHRHWFRSERGCF